MTLFLANLAMSAYFLALCYMLLTVLTFTKLVQVRRVLQQHQRSGWSIVQLLVLSIGLGCLFRTATFTTLCVFDSLSASGRDPVVVVHSTVQLQGHYADLRNESREPSEQNDLDFYNKVVVVLFSLPDFLFVSSYLLLVLVWAESFQSVRSSRRNRAVLHSKDSEVTLLHCSRDATGSRPPGSGEDG